MSTIEARFLTPSPTQRPPAPGPRGIPFLGSLNEMATDRLGFVRTNKERYGDLVSFRLGSVPSFQFNHPEAIQSVLVERQHHFVKDSVSRSLQAGLGKGLVTSDGELWRHQRKLIAPSFQPRHIEKYAQTMVDEALRTRDELEAGVIDVHRLMTRLTLRVVTATLFGIRTDGTDATQRMGEVLRAYVEEFERLNFGVARLIPSWFPGSPQARARQLARELDDIFLTLIRGREEQLEGDDLLSRLLAARDDKGQGMTAQQLRDEAVTLFVAGHETTAVALTHALHLLALHPECQQRLRTEVKVVLEGRRAGMADVSKLPFCDAVVREAMRLYPPIWTVGREVVAECTVSGVTLPVGAQVLLPQWVVHHDERWFEQPEAFRPDRWMNGLAQRLPPFAYFPFGGGPRVCIGNHFAMMESVLILATLLQAMSVAPVDGFELELVPAITLRPKSGLPLKVSLEPR